MHCTSISMVSIGAKLLKEKTTLNIDIHLKVINHDHIGFIVEIWVYLNVYNPTSLINHINDLLTTKATQSS